MIGSVIIAWADRINVPRQMQNKEGHDVSCPYKRKNRGRHRRHRCPIPISLDPNHPRLYHLRTARRNLRSEEHTSELQSHLNLVCRLLLEKKKEKWNTQV